MRQFSCINQLTIEAIANDLTTPLFDPVFALITNEANKLDSHASMKIGFLHKLFEQDPKTAEKTVQRIFAFGGTMIIDHDNKKEYHFTAIFDTETKKCTFLVSD